MSFARRKLVGVTRELRQCNVAHFSHEMEVGGRVKAKNRPPSGHDMIHLFLPADTKTSWKFHRRLFFSASTGRGGHSTPHFETLSKTLRAGWRLSTGSCAIRSRRRGHDSDFGLYGDPFTSFTPLSSRHAHCIGTLFLI